MKNWGDDSRVIVFGVRGKDTGHFFNAINKKGGVIFLDGQTGGVANMNDGYKNMWVIRTN
jgi:filamentous hemagglutinin